MIKKQQLVTVIAVCYNHEKYLSKTLDSLIKQTYKPIELIIIDACSTDSSVQKIKNWIKQNEIDCKFIERQALCKVSENLNLGISVSSGEFIQVISTDDILLPSKIENQVRLLNENPHAMMCFSNAHYIDTEGNLMYDTDNALPRTYQDQHKLLVFSECNLFADKIRDNCFIIPHSALFRRDVYEVIGNYDEELLIEDWDFFLRYFKNGLKAVLDESINTYYRVTPGSVWTSKNANLFKEQMKIFVKHDLFKNENATVLYLSLFNRMRLGERLSAFYNLILLKQFKWSFLYLFRLFEIRKFTHRWTGRIKRKFLRHLKK